MPFAPVSLQQLKTKHYKLQCKCITTIFSIFILLTLESILVMIYVFVCVCECVQCLHTGGREEDQEREVYATCVAK